MLIGVFHPHDPFGVMTEGRVHAIIAEAHKQQVQLVFFNEAGIDLDRKTIKGTVFTDDRREDGVFPFPQAVMNARPWSPLKRSDRELILRKIVPFTTFLIDDKWEITKLVADSPELGHLIVPSVVLESTEQIDELFRTHGKLVIKPVKGSRGAGVHAMVRNGGLYGIQRDAEWDWLNREQLADYIRELPKDHLLQPYIVCLTPEGEPYDFRILVQRNGEGNWTVSLIYPRIGAKETITSNVSVGGRTEELESFLQRLFPEEFRSFPPILAKLGLELAAFIDSHYANPLDELGIDLAIDGQRRIWFYEANACPGTLFYEKERAVRAIAYARHVAVKAAGDRAATQGGRETPVTLGLLFNSAPSARELDAYADVANGRGIRLVYFLPDRIRFRASTIAGFRYDGGTWTPGIFGFPDAVYNLIDQTELTPAHPVYRLGSKLRLTSREPKGPIPSSLFFAVAARHPLLQPHLPKYMRPDHPAAAKKFVDGCLSVVMKSPASRQTEDVLLIRRLNDHYIVKEGVYLHNFDEAEFIAFLDIFSNTDYILIQQLDSKTHDGHSLHIRAYLFRQPDASWETIHVAPLLALASPAPGGSPPVPVGWDWLLEREFGEEEGGGIDTELQDLTRAMAKQLQSANRLRLHELVLDLTIDRNRRIVLLGGDFDGPGDAVHAYDIARQLVPYVLSVVKPRT